MPYQNDQVGDVTLLKLISEAGHSEASEEAAADFCQRYMDKLMSLVERNLASRYASRIDPEDVVQTVLRTWFKRNDAGTIHPATDNEVWKLLSVIALNKVRNKIKFHDAQRRAVTRTTADNDLLATIPEPTEQEAIEFVDIVNTVGSRLDEMPRRTLELLVEGKNVIEIAEELGRSTKSIGRYKMEIGQILQSMLDDSAEPSDTN